MLVVAIRVASAGVLVDTTGRTSAGPTQTTVLHFNLQATPAGRKADAG